MANYTAAFTALKAFIDINITTKNTPNSIDPVDVGEALKAILDLLLPIANLVNAFGIEYGTIPPTDAVGAADALYFEFGTKLKVWKRENVSSPFWQLKASGDLGVNLIEGNISLQSSVNEDVVTVSSGNWVIDNTIYDKITQDEYTVPTPDLNFNRIDGVFAKNDGTVEYVTGIASSSPAEPATPSNSVKVSYVYVPSSSSGNLPYILDSNSPPVVPPELAKLSFTDADLVANGEDNWYLPVSIPSGRFPVGVIIDYGGGNVEYMPGGNVVDGKINGFTNNNTSVITVKLG